MKCAFAQTLFVSKNLNIYCALRISVTLTLFLFSIFFLTFCIFVILFNRFVEAEWNDLKTLPIKLESFVTFAELRDADQVSENEAASQELDIDINVGVFGAGNIGKSSLIKLLTGSKDVQIDDGSTTKEIRCYDHPDYWIGN